MPGFNKTGPLGQGPLTGRGAGKCTGKEATFFPFGFGRRRRFGFLRSADEGKNREDLSLKDEIDFLRDQIALLERKLSRKKEE